MPTLAQLRTELLRLTAFLPAPINNEPSWWNDIVGAAPETRNSTANLGLFQQAGTVANRTLTLTIQQNRVDWWLTPDQRSDTSLPQGAGPLDETLPLFGDLMSRWLREAPPSIQRLAFGVIAHVPTNDRISAYRQLASYLPAVHIDPVNSTDFGYQINRPIASRTVGQLEINRLAKWSAAYFARLVASPTGALVASPEQPIAFSSRIETDVNSNQYFEGAIPPESLPLLFNEFRELAVAIVTRGDQV